MVPLRLDIRVAATDDIHGTAHAGLNLGQGRLGYKRVGPLGLSRRLAMILGVSWNPAGLGERVAVVDARLAEIDDGTQWFSASRAHDRFGVARWMVQRIDHWTDLGWSGATLGVDGRLGTLSDLSARMPVGAPQLARTVLREVLAETGPLPLRVEVEQGEDVHAGLAGALLEALRERGVAVVDVVPEPLSGDDDLARLQRALAGERGLELQGDGSVRWIVADTPIEAAEAVAARTRTDGEEAAVLSTSEGSVLDAARRRHGLPALGLGAASSHHPVLLVLPLALELQYWPQDPAVVQQFLALPVRPLRSRVARALGRAVAEVPGVGNVGWTQAFDAALSELAEEGVASDVLERQCHRLALFVPELSATRPDVLGTTRLGAVVSELAEWAEGRARTEGEDATALFELARAARDLLELLARLPDGTSLDRIALRELYELVAPQGPTDQPTQLGAPPHADDPVGVVPGVEHLLWWGAVAGAAELGAMDPLTDEERQALQAAGCRVPDAASRRVSEHRSWVWPVQCARVRLTVVSWRNAGTEAAEPHPLFDAWAGAVGQASLARCRVEARALRQDPGLRTSEVPEAPDRSPELLWAVPEDRVIPTRDLSATSIVMMLSCSARWALTYAAGLRPGAAANATDESAVIGSFAHALLQDAVLYADDVRFDAMTPALAAERVAEAFDVRVGQEAATLLLPGKAATLTRTRRQIVEAAPKLVQVLRAGGWLPILEAEHAFSGRFAGHGTTGRIDLVVGRADGSLAVIDLKFGGASADRKLRDGKAVQLAVYAQALGDQGQLAKGAYFVIADGRLLAQESAAFPSPAWHVPSPSLGETLLGAEEAWRWWEQASKRGVVAARDHADKKTVAEDVVAHAIGVETLTGPWTKEKAPCGWCDQRRICHLALMRDVVDEGGAA